MGRTTRRSATTTPTRPTGSFKHRHVTVARRSGTVFCDRDWRSALAYAASVDDGGQLRAHTR